MTHSLYYKFLLGYLAFLFLGFLTISTVSSKMVERYLVESSAQTLYDEANLIASSYSSIYKGTNLDLSAAYPQMQAVGSFLGARIWVVDDSGSIVLDSDGSAHTGTVIEDFDPVGDGNESYSVGRYYGLFNSDVLSVSAPITGNFNTYGYVVIHLPMTEVEDGKNEILLLIYLSGAFIFLLSLIILLIFTKTVYFPLKKITYGANEYADGNLKYNIDLKTSDEMGYLAATLDYMSDELEKMEEYQRRFIANVSHDFRSPLTSIKGYVEAIIDGTVPRELEAKYLNIVISETERLNKLTEGMLTLNSLDSKGYLSRSNFGGLLRGNLQRKGYHHRPDLLRHHADGLCRSGKNPAGALQPHRQRHQVQPQQLRHLHTHGHKIREGVCLREGQRHRDSKGGYHEDLGPVLQNGSVAGKR